MQKRKKLLSIISMLLTISILVVGCGASKSDNTSTGSNGMATKEEWDAALVLSNFANVTFEFEATFLSGYEEEGPFNGTIKLDGDKMFYEELYTDTELINMIRDLYINTAINIVKQQDNFQPNEENDTYVSQKPVSFPLSYYDYDATITVTDAEATFNDDMKISTIDFIMTQEFTENGKPVTYVLDTTFEFKDYGTTVVE